MWPENMAKTMTEMHWDGRMKVAPVHQICIRRFYGFGITKRKSNRNDYEAAIHNKLNNLLSTKRIVGPVILNRPLVTRA